MIVLRKMMEHIVRTVIMLNGSVLFPYVRELNLTEYTNVGWYLHLITKTFVIMDEYERGYYDALKWVYEHTGGDNYKLSVKAKMQKFIKGE